MRRGGLRGWERVEWQTRAGISIVCVKGRQGREGERTIGLLELEGGVPPGEGEGGIPVWVLELDAVVVEEGDVPVGLFVFLAFLECYDCRVGSLRVLLGIVEARERRDAPLEGGMFLFVIDVDLVEDLEMEETGLAHEDADVRGKIKKDGLVDGEAVVTAWGEEEGLGSDGPVPAREFVSIVLGAIL